MQIGDTVTFVPAVIEGDYRERHSKTPRAEKVPGVVTYIHPKRRFYVVQYDVRGVKLTQTLYFNN